jgi:hypothetical protein
MDNNIPTAKNAAELMFKYDKFYWSSQVRDTDNVDTKLEICADFVNTALDAFCVGSELFEKKHQSKLLRVIDKHSVNIAKFTDGIEPDYKLYDGWFRSILCQLGVLGSKREGKTGEDVKKRLSKIFISQGWRDLEWCVNPKFTEDKKNLIIYWKAGTPEETEFTVYLIQTVEFPFGSVWEAGTGSEWTVISSSNDDSVLVVNKESEKTVTFHKNQVRGFKRVL